MMSSIGISRGFLLAVLVSAVAFYAPGQRQSSKRGKLKPLERAVTVGTGAVPFDTVAATAGLVRLSGYEKTLRATSETVFVSNLSENEISRVIFRVAYYDAQGRLLHRARHDCYVPVPPGETRRLDFPTWDRQFTFYYVRSPRPRVPAVPYSVEITPDTLLLVKKR